MSKNWYKYIYTLYNLSEYKRLITAKVPTAILFYNAKHKSIDKRLKSQHYKYISELK